MTIKKDTERNALPLAVTVSTLLVYVFHLLRYVHNDVWNGIYAVYYPTLIPVLIAFTIYFRWGKWKWEEKIFLLFFAWVYLSRLLNGDFFLTNDADIVLNTGMSYVFLVACLSQKDKSWQRLLDGVSIFTSAYFTLLGLLGVYAWLLRRELYNLLTGDILCSFESWLDRLMIYGRSSTEVVQWFFLSFFLLLYLFFRKKSLKWRVPILLAAIPNYLALTVTYSRSGRVALSLCLALLLMLGVLEKLPWKRLSARLLVGSACLVILIPLLFVGFKVVASGMQHASAFLVTSLQTKESAEEGGAVGSSEIMAEGISHTSASLMMACGLDESFRQENTFLAATSEGPQTGIDNIPGAKAELLTVKEDVRGFTDSGRIDIFKSIIPTMQQDPLRLLRGCLCRDVMKISNTLLPKPKPHFHNTFLQLFCLTGLPGLMLILAFCGLLAVKIIRLFFSNVPFEIKTLTLILIGTFVYNLLEVSLFVAADTRAFVAYIVAGAVLAYSYEEETA